MDLNRSGPLLARHEVGERALAELTNRLQRLGVFELPGPAAANCVRAFSERDPALKEMANRVSAVPLSRVAITTKKCSMEAWAELERVFERDLSPPGLPLDEETELVSALLSKRPSLLYGIRAYTPEMLFVRLALEGAEPLRGPEDPKIGRDPLQRWDRDTDSPIRWP